MQILIKAVLIITGIIHLMPLSGVLGIPQLQKLYGVPIDEGGVDLLMRHRAVLFGIIGAFFLFAAFSPKYQLVAVIAALISVSSFIALKLLSGPQNSEIMRVYYFDVALLVPLLGALAALLVRTPR